MGFYGTALYSNDVAEDVKASYIQLLEQQNSNEEAYHKVRQEYAELMGTGEEPLFWYALADTMWRWGRLTPDVKEKALSWIQNKGGLDLWSSNARHEAGWEKTMEKLRSRLETPQPQEKKVRTRQKVIYDPGQVGDVFAYRFHSKEAEKQGYYGKYILMQKIGLYEEKHSQMVFFDKILDEIPNEPELQALRILPYDNAQAYAAADHAAFNKLHISAYFELHADRNSPRKYMTCLGNFPLAYCEKIWDWCRQGYGWDTYTFETTTMCYHSLWQEYIYVLGDMDRVVKK